MTTPRYLLICIPILLAASAAAASATAPGDVQTTHDAPCRYPVGLATDGRHLFVLDWREARIHQVTTADGKPVKSFAAPTLRPAALTWGDGKLFVGDDHTGWVYALNVDTGVVEHAFEGPGKRVTGLAYGPDGLYLLERASGQISKVEPKDGTILGYCNTPNESCTTLAFDGKYLWAGDRVKNELYMLDPADGTVINILDAPGPYVSGLAWLGTHLWAADFQTRKLYQIVVRDAQQKYRLKDTRSARVEFLWSLYNYGPGEVRDLTVAFAIPDKLPQQELLSELEYGTPPTRIAADRWGQRCALYEIPRVAAGTRQLLTYSVSAQVSAIRYLIIPDQTGTPADIPAELRAAYTQDAPRYRTTSKWAQDTVRSIVGEEQNCYRIARKIYNHVMEKLEYEMVGGWDVPEVVLKRGKGSCSEYTFAFIALCRAAGLPARYQGSVVVRGDDASIDEAFHRWAEIYLPNYGWVPVDANRGDAKTPADQARGFGELANRFLITTHSGGPSEFLDWSYNVFARYKLSGYAKVEEENFGVWEPLTPTTAPASGPAGQAAAECRPVP
ncbi:MAG: transglutaminase domain-containing protein [Planctomycetota bacterium]